MDNKYLKIDRKINKVISRVCEYMNNLNPEYVKIEILKAYEYAKNSHY
jgi:hypothetical protein